MPQDSSFSGGPDATHGAGASQTGMIGALVAERYEIRDMIGRGAFGTVFEAYDRNLARLVALKTMPLRGASRDELLRFYREAKSLARLSHPGIVSVHDFGEMPDFAWIVMELVIGDTLRQVLEQGRPPLAEAVRVTCDLLDALQAAHDRGIVHRDVKPANILLTATAEEGLGQVRLVDFGIARVEATDMTVAGDMLGTPYAMAPEQLQHGEITPRTDIWAVGIVLHEMLTGERPFAGHVPAIFNSILRQEPPAPSSLVPGLPGALDLVVARALAKEPGDRFPSAAAMVEALRQALRPPEAPLAPRPVLVAAPVPRPPARRPIWPVALALLLGVGLGGAGVWWLGRPAPQAAPAMPEPEPAAPQLRAMEREAPQFANVTPEPPAPVAERAPEAPAEPEAVAPAPAAIPEAVPAPAEAPAAPVAEPPVAAAPALPACGPAQLVVRAARHPTYTRLVLEWRAPTPYRLERQGDAALLTFPGATCMPRGLPIVAPLRATAERNGALLLELAPGTQLRHFRLDNRVVIDLSPIAP